MSIIARTMHIIAAIVSVAAIMHSCTDKNVETEVSDQLIETSDGFTVTLNAIMHDGDTLKLPAEADTTSLSLFSSSAMLDGLVNSADSSGITDKDRLSALSNWELSMRIMLYDAWADPAMSIDLLRTRVKNGRVTSLEQIEVYWPMISDCLPWIIAAEEVYRATGDRKWLAEAAEVARKTLKREVEVNFDESGKLFRGVPVYLMTPSNHFAPWMSQSDILQSMTLFGNAVAARSLESYGRMLDLLGRKREDHLESIRTVLTERLNRSFWLPARGYCSEYLYGGAFPIQSEITDNVAQSVAMTLGTFSPAMVRSMIERTPTFEKGVSLTMPLMGDGDLPGRQHYFSLMQSMWTIASFNAGNDAAVRHSLGALCIDLLSREEPTGNVLRPVIMRGMLGMTANDTGVVFSPYIPKVMDGLTEVRNLRVRDADIDVRLSGNGNVIKNIELDGVKYYFSGIPYTLKGHHTISLELAPADDLKTDKITVADTVYAPVSPQVFWCSLSGKILNFDKELSYDIYVDGVLDDVTDSQDYDLEDTKYFTTVNFVAVDKSGWAGLAGRTFNHFPPRTRFVIPADTIEPGVKGRIKTVRNRRGRIVKRIREPHLVRLSEWRRELKFSFSMREGGKYLMYIAYTASEKDKDPKAMTIRMVSANGADFGAVVMPSVRQGRLQESSPARVMLRQGKNIVNLTTDPLSTADIYGRNGEVMIKEIILIKLPDK